MRPVLFAVALFGISFSAGFAQSQTPTPQSAPEPAVTHKKPAGTRATDSLFENGPSRPNALTDARREESQRKQPESSPEPTPARPSIPAPAPEPPAARPTVEALPPGPPQKNLTGEEFRLIHTGSSVKEVLEALGPPSSRVVVPDDDGHLRESLQYWVKGHPMGTVRLDNGRVVQIEAKP
jgi:hypothetical protein